MLILKLLLSLSHIFFLLKKEKSFFFNVCPGDTETRADSLERFLFSLRLPVWAF